MAKVIKAGVGAKAPLPQGGARMAMPVGRKVLEREVYQAQNEAKAILDEAAVQRERLLADAKRQAAQAREEAMSKGAAEAFAQAAAEALLAFRRRAERYGEAEDDIRTLALEVVKKVLGTDPALPEARVDEIMKHGMAQLRARRRLRVQVPASRIDSLADERPKLMRALADEPDLLIEAADDVNQGFARIVTEIGGALCAEHTALSTLAEALDVVEVPKVQPPPRRAEAVREPAAREPARPQPARHRARAEDDVTYEASLEDRGPVSDDSTRAHVERPRAPAPPPPRRLAPQARPGTRALQLDADPEGTQALDVADFRRRGRDASSEGPASEVDDSMDDLYTDDAVAPRARRPVK